jgi:hypothetical protein
MSTEPPQWTDRAGVRHALRSVHDLTSAERHQVDFLRQQVRYTARLLDAGYNTPAIAHAPPNMMRMMLRILLPSVAKHEIATFDTTEGDDLLTSWWATTDAAA